MNGLAFALRLGASIEGLNSNTHTCMYGFV